MNIGFSTGSIALGDFKKGISFLKERNIKVIEISALRENELKSFMNEIDDLDLESFDYVSFHAPSKLNIYSENELVRILKKIAMKKWAIIVHPDIIVNYDLWQPLGQYLCIENMDKRKNIGRTAGDLQFIFEQLPLATFCLDMAHARQVDSTMIEAQLMVSMFHSKLKQIHLSDVNSESKHESLSLESILSYSKLFNSIASNTPIILESPVPQERIESEIENASLIVNPSKLINFIKAYGNDSNYFRSYLDYWEKSNIFGEKVNEN